MLPLSAVFTEIRLSDIPIRFLEFEVRRSSEAGGGEKTSADDFRDAEIGCRRFIFRIIHVESGEYIKQQIIYTERKKSLMKKVLAFVLAAVLALSFAACTKKDGTDESNSPSGTQANLPKSSLELLEKVWGKYTHKDKFSAMGGSEKNRKEDMPGKFDVADSEALDFELGFPKDSAAEIDDAASLMHMLNQNSFSCGVYHVKSSGNIDSLAAKIKENILNRQWMCGFPEKLVILSVGDYIVSVFGAGELIDTFISKLTAEYGSAKQLFDVPIA